MDLPGDFLPHEVRIKPLTGSGGMGTVYGAEVTVVAFVLDVRELVRDKSGAEVVSSTKVYVQTPVEAPTDSLVTVWPGTSDERQASVITAAINDRPDNWGFRVLSLT